MKRILRRLKLVFDNPKRTLKHFVFKSYIMFDRTYKNTWKLVDQTPGWLSKYEGYLLFYLARKCSPLRTIVEIGSYEGRSTIALASGAHEGLIIHAIDPHTGDKTQVEAGLKINTYESFLKNTKNFNNIHAIRKLSVDATQDVSVKAIQLLFIDGWHSEKAVNDDIQTFLPLLFSSCTIVFDDWTNGEVSAGIIRNLILLPPVVGVIGKDLIFSNDTSVTKSFLAKVIKRTTPSSVLNTYSSDLIK